MPFGMGRQGWAYVHPRYQHWCHRWYGRPAAYDWPVAIPHWAPWRPLSKDQEAAILEDEARVLEEELSQIKKRLEDIRQ